eukprot:3878963-Rhodomonas_salina.3
MVPFMAPEPPTCVHIWRHGSRLASVRLTSCLRRAGEGQWERADRGVGGCGRVRRGRGAAEAESQGQGTLPRHHMPKTHNLGAVRWC